jgi:magnesium chelatase family protein
MAMNSCVCGNLSRSNRPCACTPAAIATYRGHVPGPLPDRFHLHVKVPPVPSETGTILRLRRGAAVAAERRIREGRFEGTSAVSKAQMSLGLSVRARDGELAGQRYSPSPVAWSRRTPCNDS